MPPDSLPPAITRRELHALVWSTPLTTLAKRFGTTGSHLAMVCDDHQVPRPGAGHWSKKAFGKEPALVVLPAGRAEDELVDLAEPAPSPRRATPRQPPAPVQKAPQAPKPEEPVPTISFPMTRAQLHHLVWSTPVQKLAPRFQCSGVWLAKLCKKNQVPTPPRGYWAKRQVGKSPRTLALPRGVDPHQVVLEAKPEPVPPPPPEPPAPPPPPHDPDVASLLKILEGFAPIEMPADLSKAHPVVAQARRALKERSRTDRWGHYVLPAHPTRNPLTLDITEPHRERAFKILDSILRTLERLGFKTTAQDVDHLRTDAITEMLGGRFHFHVRERYKLVRTERDGRTERVMEHTGLLALDLLKHGRYVTSPCATWKDGSHRGPIDTFLKDVVHDTILAAQQARRDVEAQRQKEIAEQRARVAQWREEEARRAEERRVACLLSQSRRWERAARLRRFIEACRVAGRRGDGDALTENWLQWATEVADSIDPFGGAGPQAPA